MRVASPRRRRCCCRGGSNRSTPFLSIYFVRLVVVVVVVVTGPFLPTAWAATATATATATTEGAGSATTTTTTTPAGAGADTADDATTTTTATTIFEGNAIQCASACTSSSNEPVVVTPPTTDEQQPQQDGGGGSYSCDCCLEGFDNPAYESSTTRAWWKGAKNNSKNLSANRVSWVRKRPLYDPLAGEGTVIGAVLWTFTDRVLKFNVVFPPLYPQESRIATVRIRGVASATTLRTSSCRVAENTWNCIVQMTNVPETEAYTYTVSYEPNATEKPGLLYTYQGTIPIPEAYPRIAALGCFGPDVTWDKSKLVESVLETKPDMLVLQGDQTYFHWDALYGTFETYFALRKLMQNIPTIVQLDDHDYGLGNLWGAGEGAENSGEGFLERPSCLFNKLQHLAMGHNPDPATTTKLDNGIDIYYTNYVYGKTDLAVIEARKFKNMEDGDGASLLGEEQEQWLTEWCASNTDLTKVILTQTPFGSLGTHATKTYTLGIGPTSEVKDTNAFPIAGRQRFMNIIKGCSQIILAGDQHLSIAVAYDNDGENVLECTSPAASNDIWWRLNLNQVGGVHRDYTGNVYQLLGVWNVDPSLRNYFKSPITTQPQSDRVKDLRGDGFLIADIEGPEGRAVCEAHSFRTSHEVKWRVQTPTEPIIYTAATLVEQGVEEEDVPTRHKKDKPDKSVSSDIEIDAMGEQVIYREEGGDDAPTPSQSTCRSKCYLGGSKHICSSDSACSSCEGVEDICYSLCLVCPTGSLYGGLPCQCHLN